MLVSEFLKIEDAIPVKTLEYPPPRTIKAGLMLYLFPEGRGYDLLIWLWMNETRKILTETRPSLFQVIH